MMSLLEVEARATGETESGGGSVLWARLLPGRAQSAEETEACRGCFLLARPLLEKQRMALFFSMSETASFQLESNLQKRLKLAEVVFCSRGLYSKPWSVILEKQRMALFFSVLFY